MAASKYQVNTCISEVTTRVSHTIPRTHSDDILLRGLANVPDPYPAVNGATCYILYVERVPTRARRKILTHNIFVIAMPIDVCDCTIMTMKNLLHRILASQPQIPNEQLLI